MVTYSFQILGDHFHYNIWDRDVSYSIERGAGLRAKRSESFH